MNYGYIESSEPYCIRIRFLQDYTKVLLINKINIIKKINSDILFCSNLKKIFYIRKPRLVHLHRPLLITLTTSVRQIFVNHSMVPTYPVRLIEYLLRYTFTVNFILKQLFLFL